MERDSKLKQIGILAWYTVFLSVFGYAVWPTPYRYEHVRWNEDVLSARINRFTDTAEVLEPSGWRTLGRSKSSDLEAIGGGKSSVPVAKGALSNEELSQLSGTLSFSSNGWMSAQIYNGTSRTVTYIVVELSVLNADGTLLFKRQYRLVTANGRSLSASDYGVDSGFTPAEGQKTDWHIVSASE